MVLLLPTEANELYVQQAVVFIEDAIQVCTVLFIS